MGQKRGGGKRECYRKGEKKGHGAERSGIRKDRDTKGKRAVRVRRSDVSRGKEGEMDAGKGKWGQWTI